jgi:hypothetical protein
MADRSDDRSLGELFAELSRETGQLVRKEVELATTEMTAKVTRAAKGAGVVAAGGTLMHAGLLVLMAAIVSALVQMGLSLLISALVVAAATMAIGYMLVTSGLTKIRHTKMAPKQTIESLKETATWTTRQGA